MQDSQMTGSLLEMSHDDRDVLDTLGISEEMLLAGKVFEFTVIDAFAGDGSIDQLRIEALAERVLLDSRKHGIASPSIMKHMRYDIYEKLKNLD